MGYWPWYSRIEPEHRYLYLDWLASGKRSLPPLEGLLFLYYYGLERRILIDDQDRSWILPEVARLRKLDEPRRGSRDGASFRTYSTNLLWFEVARVPELFDDDSYAKICKLTDQWTTHTLAPALAWLLKQDRRLSPEMARRVAQAHPQSERSVVLKRVADQFENLFAKRYIEQFGPGVQLNASKRQFRHTYRPASGGLDEVACSIPDVMGIPSQFEPLAELWNSSIADLRRLSKVAVAPTTGEFTVETWEALPNDLRDGVDHPLAPAIHSIVAEGSQNGQECLVSAGRLAPLLQLEHRPKLTSTQSRRLAQTIEFTGYSIEPDARMTGRGYGWDDRVAVFLRTDETDADASRYAGASCMLRLGLAVAEADGDIDEEELRRLTEQIEAAFQLPDHERRRLEALKALLLTTGSEIGPIARKIEQTLSPLARQAVGRLLVAIAAANGAIDRKEQTALRKCYRALGLGPEVLEQTIAELLPVADSGMVTVQPGGRADQGEAIPAQKEARLELNRETISAIMAETREVAKLLADAMVVEDDEMELTTSAAAVAVENAPSGRIQPGTAVLEAPTQNEQTDKGQAPSGRYAEFYKSLVERENWSRAEATDLARKHGVMLAGAIEAINDWAFESFGAPLIDEAGDAVNIDRSLI
jgi:tellurite resistance protein